VQEHDRYAFGITAFLEIKRVQRADGQTLGFVRLDSRVKVAVGHEGSLYGSINNTISHPGQRMK
jgi:hypothetical protein